MEEEEEYETSGRGFTVETGDTEEEAAHNLELVLEIEL